MAQSVSNGPPPGPGLEPNAPLPLPRSTTMASVELVLSTDTTRSSFPSPFTSPAARAIGARGFGDGGPKALSANIASERPRRLCPSPRPGCFGPARYIPAAVMHGMPTLRPRASDGPVLQIYVPSSGITALALVRLGHATHWSLRHHPSQRGALAEVLSFAGSRTIANRHFNSPASGSNGPAYLTPIGTQPGATQNI